MGSNTQSLPLLAAGGCITLERMVTVLLWEYESNPLVLDLGLGPWVGLSLILLLGAWVAWEPLNAKHSRAGAWLMWAVAGYHTLAVVSNLVFVHTAA